MGKYCDFPNLEILDISENYDYSCSNWNIPKIKKISLRHCVDIFDGLNFHKYFKPSLEHIDLYDTRVYRIFKRFSLGGIYIKRLNSQVFSKLTNLKVIYGDFQQSYKDIPLELISLPSVETWYISNYTKKPTTEEHPYSAKIKKHYGDEKHIFICDEFE